MRAFVTLSVVLSILLFNVSLAGVTGKIAGTVVDAKTGEKLVSVNVQIIGGNIGATTNVDGYFAILNVPPGAHTVQASLLGFTQQRAADVRVSIDQTTTLNFRLTETAVLQQEVTVVAERPVVQRDVSSSRVNISEADVEKLPTATIVGVVALQAGSQTNANGDLIIRGSGGLTTAGGGGSDQVVFLLNGQSLRDGRDNSPYTGISLTSIENVQVNSGGFNAEYGQVRSGLVNVVTKEGNASKYSVGATARYSPADPKHFGPSPYDQNSFFIRPFVDPAVAWTGTGKGYDPGAWDKWTRDQYATFEGWNSIAQKTLQDNDPTNDLTPQAAQKLFLWQHRQQAEVAQSDYDIDAGFGGPLIPGVSESLGNLRFYAAYRRNRSAYLIPLSEASYRDQNFQLKITTDLGQGMKFSVEGLYAEAFGTNDNNAGTQGIYTSPSSIATNLNRVSFIDTRIFAPDYWAPTVVRRKMLGAKLTDVLSSETFYNVQLTMFQSRYNTAPGRLRDNSRIYKFGNSYYVDEAPFGFQPFPLGGNYTSIEGIGPTPAFRMGVGMSNSRDQSIVTNYTMKADITSQLDRVNQLQVGGEFTLTDSDIDYSNVDVYLPSGRTATAWHTYPKQAAAYVQDKLEFEGMIANIGVRMDYSYAGGEWYKITDPYAKAFASNRSLGIDTLLAKEPTKKMFTVSPRLGVAFPISENSKLFFNYGHFRSLPTPENLFIIRRTTDAQASLTRIADPNSPLPRTIQYELGYEHNLFDEILLRLSGYYKDITDETRLVTYTNGNDVNYSISTSNTYRDIRGFEITLNKNRGNWIQGFLNYTYDVRSNAYFGFAQYQSNRVLQTEYENRNVDTRVSKPVPQPYARANVEFFTPPDLGPGHEGLSLLGDWRMNLTGSWSSGSFFTWNGGISTPGVENNVQWRDIFGVDMRFSKSFNLMGLNLQFFADITNLFNLRNMTDYGFFDITDFNSYMQSLHLSSGAAGDVINQKFGYPNIPGSDQPGDYRKDGVVYQPIVGVARYSDLGTNPGLSQTRPYYYVADRGQYYQQVNGAWQVVDPGKLQQTMDDKAYIDMPNLESFTFLNPRNIFYGVRLSFDF